MSDAYLLLLLANMQQELNSLREQAASLTARLDDLEAGELDGEPDAPGTYMDGAPIR